MAAGGIGVGIAISDDLDWILFDVILTRRVVVMLTALLLDLRIGIALGVCHLLNHIDDLANYFCLLSLSKLNGDVWYASGDSNL